jgi:hypothetical protein
LFSSNNTQTNKKDQFFSKTIQILNNKLKYCSTGSVVTPYTRYPTLLETLLGFLRTEQKATIRSQTLRLLGLMGALDPYQHKMMMGQVGSIKHVLQSPALKIMLFG